MIGTGPWSSRLLRPRGGPPGAAVSDSLSKLRNHTSTPPPAHLCQHAGKHRPLTRGNISKATAGLQPTRQCPGTPLHARCPGRSTHLRGARSRPPAGTLWASGPQAEAASPRRPAATATHQGREARGERGTPSPALQPRPPPGSPGARPTGPRGDARRAGGACARPREPHRVGHDQVDHALLVVALPPAQAVPLVLHLALLQRLGDGDMRPGDAVVHGEGALGPGDARP